MPYFFSAENLSLGRIVSVGGEESRHILLAHRAKKGEKVKLQGPDGKRFLSEIVSADKKSLRLKVIDTLVVPIELNAEMVLFQATVSEKALDFILQKGTELGLSKIILFNSANSASKLSAEQFKKKFERWQKIATEAAKQSERAKWPGVEFVADVGQVMLKAETSDKVFLTDISGEKLGSNQVSSSSKSIVLIVGPEGGFTEQEVKQFQVLKNLQTVSLGPVLLRAETAALTAVSLVRNSYL